MDLHETSRVDPLLQVMRLIDQAQKQSEIETNPDPPFMRAMRDYFETDGVVAWQGSIQAPSKNNERTENIEVFASHIGLGVNPSTWWAVANRLSQTHKNWTPFVPPKLMGLQNVLYPQDK